MRRGVRGAKPKAGSQPAAPAQPTLARRLGNAGLLRMLQAKLIVGDPQDHFEQEADRVADHVMRMPEQAAGSADPPAPAPAQTTIVQRAADASSALPVVDTALEEAVAALDGRGGPLSPEIRSFMEPRFGADLRDVRIHTDAHAHELARAVNARAFAVGRNVVFGAGYYAPHTEGGRHLIAHELTHTLQQGAATRLAREPEHKKTLREQLPPHTPLVLSAASPLLLAQRAAGELKKQNGGTGVAANSRFLVAADALYVYSADFKLLEKIDLKKTPPLVGVFVGDPAQGRSRFVNMQGRVHLVKDDNWGKGEWVTNWADVTANDLQTLVDSNFYIVVIGHVASPASKSDKPGEGSGGGGTRKAQAPRSAPASKSKQKGEGKEPIVRSFPGDAYTGQRSDQAANHGAFPSSIKLSSSLLPAGGASDATMRLVWQYYETDPVMAVWNASTRVTYRWERWNVTEAVARSSREEVEKALRQTAFDAAARVDDEYSDYDRQRRTAEYEEQTEHSQEVIEQGGTAGRADDAKDAEVLEERINRRLRGVSAAVSTAGHVVDGVWHRITRPEHGITLTWPDQGIHLIRCIASPWEHGGRRYESSVATAFVEVRPREYIARNTLGAAEQSLVQLRIQRELATDPKEIQRLDGLIADVTTSAYGPVVDALGLVIARKQAGLKTARGAEREKLEKELKELEKQLKQARWNEEGYVGPDGKPGHAFRPQAVFVSDTSGTTFPLLLQLLPAPEDGVNQWVLRDVTTAGDKLGKGYFGRGATNRDAIVGAFHLFAHDNAYGFGTLMVRLPDSIPDARPTEIVLRNYPAAAQLAKERLTDLATMFMIAGVAAPAIGQVGMYLGATLSAENILNRWRSGKLEPDLAFMNDLLQVLGALASGASRIAALQLVPAGETFALAQVSGDLKAIEKALAAVKRTELAARVAEKANDLATWGGVAVADYQLIERLKAIGEAECNGTMTHSEAGAQRGKAILGALQSKAMLFTGLLHKPVAIVEGPPVTTGSAPKPSEPAPRGAKPSHGEEGAANERTVLGRVFGRGAKPPHGPTAPEKMPVPWLREGPDSPERLFERLAQGPDPNTRIPPVPPGRRPVSEETLFSSGIKRPDDAYRAYNNALAVAGGREVAIWYRTDTGEYAVKIGTFGAVKAPDTVKPWIAIVHFHPNEHRSLTLRLPAPTSDFASLWERARFEHGVVREIVEWDMPDGSRGRTEYGIDLSHPNEPLYIRTSQPDGTLGPPQRFSEKGYAEYHAARTHFIEKGSPLHKELLPQKGRKQPPDANRRTAMPPASGSGDGDGPRPRQTSITAPYPTIKRLGPFTYTSQEASDGNTADWRVWNWARVGGPSKVANRDAQQFLEQLVAQARAAGNDMLVLTIENIEAPSVQRLSRPDSPMAKHLGVTAVERVDDRTIRWVIPLRGTAETGGAAGGPGGGGAPRAMIVPHDSPETRTVVGGIGREPGRTPEAATDAVVVGGFGREPGRTPEAARDAVVVGGFGREPGRTPELAEDPVAVGGFGRDPSRPPDVPEHLSPSDGVPVSLDESDDTTGARTNPVPRPGSEGDTPPGTTPRRDAVPEHIDDDGPGVHRIAPPRSGSPTGTGAQGRSPRRAPDAPAGSTPPSRSPESSGGSGSTPPGSTPSRSTPSRSTLSGSTPSGSTPLRSTVGTGSATPSGTTNEVSGRSPADPLASTPLESPTPPHRSPGAPDPFAPTPQESPTQVQTGTPTQVDPANLFSAGRSGEAERLAPAVERVNLDQWVHPIQQVGEGINTKYLLVDAVTGERWLFKPALGEEGMLFGPELGIRTGERWRRALAAAYLAQDLGLNTPYVRLIEMNGMVGSLQEWRQGYAARPRIRNQAQADFDRFWNSRFRHDIDAFDYFIANQDRHQGNVMIRMEGDRPSAMVIDQDAGIPASAERFSRQPPPSGRRLESWQRDLPPSVSRELAERFRDLAARFPDAELRKWLTGKEVDGLWSRLNEVVDALDDGRIGIIEESPTRAAETAQTVSGSRRTAGNAAGGAFSTNAATQSATGTFSTNAATEDAVSGSVSTSAATVDASTTPGRSGSGSPTPSESPTPSRSPGSATTTATGNDPSPGSSARTTEGPGESSGSPGEAPLPKAAAIVAPGPEPSAGARSNVQVSAADAITIDSDVERQTAQGPRQTSMGASASGQAVTVDVRTGGPGRQTTGAVTVTGQDIGVEVGRQKQGKGGPTAGIKLDSQGNPTVEAGWTFQTKGGSSIKPTFSHGTRVDAREPVQLEDGRFLVAYAMTETTTAGAGGAARRTPQGRPGFSAGGHFSRFEAESKQGTRIFKTKLEAEAFRNNAALQLAFEQANAVPASSGEAAKIAVGETRGEADTKGSSAGLSGSFGGTTLGRNWQTSETTGRSFYRVSEDLLNVTTTVTRDKAKDWGIGALVLANQKGGDTTTAYGVTFQFNISTPAGREALDLYLKTGFPPLSGARIVSVMNLTGEGSYDRYQMPTLGTAAWSDRAWQKVTRGEEGVTKEFGGEQVHQQDPTWLAELTGDRELYSSAQLISQQIRGKEQYTAVINIKSESGTYNREQFGKIFMGVRTTGPVEQSGAWTLTAGIDKRVVHELEKVSTKFKDAKNRDDKQRILSEVFRKTGAGMAGGLVRSGGGFMLSWDLELKGDPNFPGPAGRHELVMQREELARKLKTSPEAAAQVVRESQQVLAGLEARRKAVSDEKKYTDLPDELRKQQVALIDRHRHEFNQLRSNALMAAGKRDPGESIHAIRARLKKRDAYDKLEPEKRDLARLQDMVADHDAAINEIRQEIIVAREALKRARYLDDIPAKFRKHYLPYKAAMKEADQFHGEQAKLGPTNQSLRDRAVQSLAAAGPQAQTDAWRMLEGKVSNRLRLLTLELNKLEDAGTELVPLTTRESRWGARYDDFWAPIEDIADEEPEEEFVPVAASMTLEERKKPRRGRR